jgi:CTP synthase
MTKYVFVTGGVVSSVGKGISAASIARILKDYGFVVSVQKLDPYLNVDPGTMSPYQHGEVFVTRDGCETDLDLGHYERFIDLELTRLSNLTAGQVYWEVISKERRGDYLGGTIQTVPHVTNLIKEQMKALALESLADVLVVEVGGTVGDIEGLPFLEAIRQMRNDVGKDNVFYIHVTLLPRLSSTGELKTKPTQHSVKELRSIGIQPDCIICRCDEIVPDNIKEKIALFCDVEQDSVIPLQTVDTIYEVPLILSQAGMGDLIINSLNLPKRKLQLQDWRNLVERIKTPRESIDIAIVGKYADLPDAYISVKEALNHAALAHDRAVHLKWIPSEMIEREGPDKFLEYACGIVVPGGFGSRGIEGMISAAKYARENDVPYLGLCLGMQLMVIETARNVAGLTKANSTEFDAETLYPVIDLMPDQRLVADVGGTMRLGIYPCQLEPDSIAGRSYGEIVVDERHRHRFEFNNNYKSILSESGLTFSGVSPDGKLVEIAENKDHLFMLGTQFHPEFLSRPGRPHPLFSSFIEAASSIVRSGTQAPLPLVEIANPERNEYERIEYGS